MTERGKPKWSIIEFIRETFELEVDEDATIPFEEIYELYRKWVDDNFERYAKPRDKLGRSLTLFGSGSDTKEGLVVRTNLRYKASRNELA